MNWKIQKVNGREMIVDLFDKKLMGGDGKIVKIPECPPQEVRADLLARTQAALTQVDVMITNAAVIFRDLEGKKAAEGAAATARAGDRALADAQTKLAGLKEISTALEAVKT